MNMNMESLFWLTNKEWYRVNEEKDCFEILDFAPEEAKSSFEIWSGKSKKEEIDIFKLNRLREKIYEWKNNSSEPRIYSVDEVPHFDIDFKELIKYAKSLGKTVPELSDPEKNRFITEATLDDVRKKSLNVFTTEEKNEKL